MTWEGVSVIIVVIGVNVISRDVVAGITVLPMDGEGLILFVMTVVGPQDGFLYESTAV